MDAMKKWMIARIKNGRDLNFCEEIQKFGVETFSPATIEKRRVKGKRQDVEIRRPVYAGYVFIVDCPFVFSYLRDCKDCFSILKINGIPSYIFDPVVDQLRTFFELKMKEKIEISRPVFVEDETVEVIGGAFAGQKVVFLRMEGKKFAVCRLRVLGKSSEVKISPFLLVQPDG
jgi:transcription antitermination factor NusG